MAITVRNLEPDEGSAHTAGRAAGTVPKARINAILVTEDDSLWPQIGKFIPSRFTLKQVDSVEQLLGDLDAGAPAVLLWDARAETDVIARLSAMQQHSPRLAVVVLDRKASAALTRLGTLVRYPAGQAIFAKGDPGDSLMVVLEGQIKIRPSPPTPKWRSATCRATSAGSSGTGSRKQST